jgi:O-antigen/teichoic acid export membrane protein
MISLQVVFAPVVSRLVGKDDYKTLERVLRTGATVAAIVTAVAWVPILLAPDTLLQWVFGEVYRQAADVLIVLTLGNLANVLTGLAGTALMMSRHEHIVVRIQWLGVALRIVGGGVAASMFGLIGLGVSAAVVTAIVMIALWISARRLMDVKTHLTWRPSLRLLREISG